MFTSNKIGKNAKKYYIYVHMFYSIHAPEIYEKLNYSSMDNSNYYLQITIR